VPRFARLLRGRDYRDIIAQVTGSRDRHTIVVALPDDTMGYVFARLRESGGRGVVALGKDGSTELAVVGPTSTARLKVAQEDDSLAVVHHDVSVDMFFACLRAQRVLVIESPRAGHEADRTAHMIDDLELTTP
jgi:hypothetical protein